MMPEKWLLLKSGVDPVDFPIVDVKQTDSIIWALQLILLSHVV